MGLFVNCEKAKHYCDKCQYDEMGFWGKLRLKFHLMMCKDCKDKSIRNKRLTKLIKEGNLEKMPPECRERLKKCVEEGLKNQK